MFTYIPNLVEEEFLKVNIFIPFTKIQDATLISLFNYNVKFIQLEDGFDYSNYFKTRWEEGKTFVNVEHDIVVYPGAIKALWDCPEDWCVYDYTTINWSEQLAELNSVPLGCVKISSKMIELLKDCWNEPINWSYCDSHLFQVCKKVGLHPHQHFPGVTNANPAFLERRKI